MNKIILVGNLTRDPELNSTNSGISVCRIGIAVNRPFVSANSTEPNVDFFNVVAWRGLGENCAKFLKKGNKVAVSGRVEIRNYDDKDGNKRTVVDVIADDVEFLSPKTSGEGGYDAAPSAPAAGKKQRIDQLQPVTGDDDLPF